MPPVTRSPTFTFSSTSGGRKTSTRLPNLMRPTRSPRSTGSSTRFQNTMRRAMSPAICLNTTREPSPSMVTVFCSFCSEALSSKAGRNLPLW